MEILHCSDFINIRISDCRNKKLAETYFDTFRGSFYKTCGDVLIRLYKVKIYNNKFMKEEERGFTNEGRKTLYYNIVPAPEDSVIQQIYLKATAGYEFIIENSIHEGGNVTKIFIKKK